MQIGPEEDEDELMDFDVDEDEEVAFEEEPDEELLKEMQDEFGISSESVDESSRQERMTMAREAASASVRSEEGLKTFPEPEERGYYISDLFFKAAYVDAAKILDKSKYQIHRNRSTHSSH